MSDNCRITNETKIRHRIIKGSYQSGSARERRRWRGVLLSFTLKHYGHDYFVAEIDSLGRIV